MKVALIGATGFIGARHQRERGFRRVLHRGRTHGGSCCRHWRGRSDPGPDDEARARLGESFAEVLLPDQGTSAAKARSKLGWRPSRPSLVDEFRHGSYRK